MIKKPKKASLFICASLILILIISGCGDNVKKIVGGPVTEQGTLSRGGVADTASIAQMTVFLSQLCCMIGGSYGQANPSPTLRKALALRKSDDWVEIEGPDSNGWYEWEITDSELPEFYISMKFRFFIGNDPVITPTIDDTAGWSNIADDITKVEFDMTASSEDMYLTFDMAIDDLDSASFTISGEMTIADYLTAETFEIEFDNITGNEYGPTGGTITLTSSSGYSAELSFNSDHSADGFVYYGGSQAAKIHINPDGTGTYTDDTGTHSITV